VFIFGLVLRCAGTFKTRLESAPVQQNLHPRLYTAKIAENNVKPFHSLCTSKFRIRNLEFEKIDVMNKRHRRMPRLLKVIFFILLTRINLSFVHSQPLVHMFNILKNGMLNANTFCVRKCPFPRQSNYVHN